MHISLFTVEIPANYTSEFCEPFESTTFLGLCLDEGNRKIYLMFRGTTIYGTI
jgi:hypothetical protein